MEQVNELSEDLESRSEDELRTMGTRLRERARDGEPLEDLLVEVFALVREVSRRTIGLRHYDVQLIGGMALHDGRIAEMPPWPWS